MQDWPTKEMCHLCPKWQVDVVNYKAIEYCIMGDNKEICPMVKELMNNAIYVFEKAVLPSEM